MSESTTPTGLAARCDYCLRPQADVGTLVHGCGERPVTICRGCVSLATTTFDAQDRQRATQPGRLATIPSPKDIVAHLDRSVVGQDRAKRTLAIAVSNHFKRLLDASDKGGDDPVIAGPALRHITIEKSNVLLIGPSGSGKTHLARSLAEYLSVPFAVADATTLTEAGYVGEDVESILHKLLVASNMDVQRAQQGVVYIDEIDKLGCGRVHGKDMRLGVQHALLKMIEGTTCQVPPSGGYKTVGETCIPFDSSNVLFICGGAFGGLADTISRRLGRGACFGFDRPTPGRLDEEAHPLRHVLPEDLEWFGLIPELLGRLPVIATLDDLGVEDLVRILREPKNSLIGQYKKLLAYHQAELEVTEGALREVARIAHERGTGARGLRAVVEGVLEPILFDPQPWATYRVTEECVRAGEPEVYYLGPPAIAPLRARVARRSGVVPFS